MPPEYSSRYAQDARRILDEAYSLRDPGYISGIFVELSKKSARLQYDALYKPALTTFWPQIDHVRAPGEPVLLLGETLAAQSDDWMAEQLNEYGLPIETPVLHQVYPSASDATNDIRTKNAYAYLTAFAQVEHSVVPHFPLPADWETHPAFTVLATLQQIQEERRRRLPQFPHTYWTYGGSTFPLLRETLGRIVPHPATSVAQIAKDCEFIFRNVDLNKKALDLLYLLYDRYTDEPGKLAIDLYRSTSRDADTMRALLNGGSKKRKRRNKILKSTYDEFEYFYRAMEKIRADQATLMSILSTGIPRYSGDIDWRMDEAMEDALTIAKIVESELVRNGYHASGEYIHGTTDPNMRLYLITVTAPNGHVQKFEFHLNPNNHWDPIAQRVPGIRTTSLQTDISHELMAANGVRVVLHGGKLRLLDPLGAVPAYGNYMAVLPEFYQSKPPHAIVTPLYVSNFLIAGGKKLPEYDMKVLGMICRDTLERLNKGERVFQYPNRFLWFVINAYKKTLYAARAPVGIIRFGASYPDAAKQLVEIWQDVGFFKVLEKTIALYYVKEIQMETLEAFGDAFPKEVQLNFPPFSHTDESTPTQEASQPNTRFVPFVSDPEDIKKLPPETLK